METKIVVHRNNFEVEINIASFHKLLCDVRAGDEVAIDIVATCKKDFYPFLHADDWSSVENMNFFIDEGIKGDFPYRITFDSLQRLIRTLMFSEDSFLERKFLEDAEAGAWQHA